MKSRYVYLHRFADGLFVASAIIALFGAGDSWWQPILILFAVLGAWCAGSMGSFEG